MWIFLGSINSQPGANFPFSLNCNYPREYGLVYNLWVDTARREYGGKSRTGMQRTGARRMLSILDALHSLSSQRKYPAQDVNSVAVVKWLEDKVASKTACWDHKWKIWRWDHFEVTEDKHDIWIKTNSLLKTHYPGKRKTANTRFAIFTSSMQTCWGNTQAGKLLMDVMHCE